MKMYNCPSRSHSPRYDLQPKRKAAARNSAKGPRKVPRRDSLTPKTQTVTGDSSSDNDAGMPLKMGEGHGANSDYDDDDEVRVGISHEEGTNNAYTNDPEERSRSTEDEDSGSDHVNKVDKLRSTTSIATRGRVADTNLKSSLAHQIQGAATVSKIHKPFIALDFEAIRQGFLEGGVKSTDGNSTSGTSLLNYTGILNIMI